MVDEISRKIEVLLVLDYKLYKSVVTIFAQENNLTI